MQHSWQPGTHPLRPLDHLIVVVEYVLVVQLQPFLEFELGAQIDHVAAAIIKPMSDTSIHSFLQDRAVVKIEPGFLRDRD